MAKIELHYSENILGLTESFISAKEKLITDNGKTLFLVRTEKRAQLLQKRFFFKNTRSVRTYFPFISEETFFNDLYNRLNIPYLKLKIGQQLFLLSEAIRNSSDRLNYFSSVPNGFTTGMLNNLLLFLNELRLSDSTYLLMEEGQASLNFSGHASLLGDLRTIYENYQKSFSDFAIDRADLLKIVIRELNPEFLNKHFPGLKNLIWENVEEFKKIQSDFVFRLKQLGINIFLLFPYGDNKEIFSPKFSRFVNLKNLSDECIRHFETAEISKMLFQLDATKIDLKGRISVKSFPDRLREIENLAGEIKKIVVDENARFNDIAVGCTDLSRYQGLISAVFKRYRIPYQISANQSLKQSLLYQHFSLLLRLVEDDFPVEILKKVLQSPFFRYRDMLKNGDYLKIITGLRVSGGKENVIIFLEKEREFFLQDQETVDLYPAELEIYDCLISTIKTLYRDLEFFEHPQNISEIFKFVQDFFKKNKTMGILLRQAGEKISSWAEENFNALKAFLTALADWRVICRLSKRQDALTPQELSGLFKILEENVRYSLRRPQNFGVQVFYLQHFSSHLSKYLFIVGMEDGAFPARSAQYFAQPQALPGELQKFLPSEPLFRHREQFLQILENPAKKIQFSYPIFEQDNPLLPSLFLRELERISRASPGDQQSIKLGSRASLLEKFSRLNWQKDISPAFWDKLPAEAKSVVTKEDFEKFYFKKQVVEKRQNDSWNGVYFGDKISKKWLEKFFSKKSFSASQLEQYAFCPLLFFFQRVLEVSPFEAGEEFLTPRDRGLVVHQILFRFFSENQPKDRTLEKLLFIGDQELEKIPVPRGILWDLEKETFTGNPGHKGLLPAFWDYEQKSSLMFTTQPKYFELAFGLSSKSRRQADPASSAEPFLWKDRGEEFRLRGKIDRVEISNEGAMLIVDYKTGSLANLPAMLRGEKLQLPLYLKAAKNLLEKKEKNLRMSGGVLYSIKEAQSIEKKVIFVDAEENLGKVRIARGARLLHESEQNEDSLPGFNEFIDQSFLYASDYIRSVRNGEFPFTKEKKRCVGWRNKSCEFWPLCRRNLGK